MPPRGIRTTRSRLANRLAEFRFLLSTFERLVSSITFYCLCGKKLKARAASAGKRTQCPQCGEPVGIPASSSPVAPPTSRKEAVEAAVGGEVRGEGREIPDQEQPVEARSPGEPPSHSQAAHAPLPPDSPPREKQNTSSPKPAATPKPGEQPTGPLPYFMDESPAPPPRPVNRKSRKKKAGNAAAKKTRGLPEGTSPGDAAQAASQSLADSPEDGIELRNRPKWYRLISRGEYRGPSATHEFGISLGNAPLVITVSLVLALTIGMGAFQLPAALQNSHDSLAVVVLMAVVFAVAAGHVCSYFSQTILNAALNLGKSIDLDPVRTTKVSFAWVSAILAGPVLAAFGTFQYWLRIGLEDPVDWIIFGELIWLTFFWLTASLLSYAIDLELKAMLPHRAFRKARLIPRAIAIRSAIAAGLCAATIGGVWMALVEIHENNVGGFLLLSLTFLIAVSLGGVLAKSLGRSAQGLIPHEKKEPEADAGAQEFERQLASQS